MSPRIPTALERPPFSQEGYFICAKENKGIFSCYIKMSALNLEVETSKDNSQARIYEQDGTNYEVQSAGTQGKGVTGSPAFSPSDYNYIRTYE